MPSVSSLDNSYQQYVRSLSEVEDELRADAKEDRKRRDEQVDELEERQKASIAKQQESTEEALRRQKETFHKDWAYERKASQEDLDEARQEITRTYDRFGRMQGEKDSALHLANEAIQNERKTSIKRWMDQENQSDKNLREQEERFNKELDQVTNSMKRNFNETLDSRKQNDKNRIQEMSNRYSRTIEHLAAENERDLRFEQNRATHGIQQVEDAARMKEEKAARYNERKSSGDYEGAVTRALRDTETMRDAQRKELDRFSGRFAEFAEVEKQRYREVSQAKAQALRELEDDLRLDTKRADKERDIQLAHQKQVTDQVEKNLRAANTQNLKEKNAQFTHLYLKQQRGYENSLRDIQHGYDRALEEINHLRDKEKLHFQKQYQDQKEILTSQMTRSLASQDDTHSANYAEFRGQKDSDIQRLETELQELKSTPDPSRVSPAAADNLRDRVITEYHGKLETERQRNQEEADYLRMQHAKRLHDEAQRNRFREMDLVRESALRASQDRREFQELIAGTTAQHEGDKKSQEYNHNREIHKMQLLQERELATQRRHYEEILKTLQTDYDNQLRTLRQESDFNSKMAHREFSDRYNNTIREYERKLSDQKEQYDYLFSVQRESYENQLREAEKRKRYELESQSKAYEQRIAQVEQRYNTRESQLAESYEAKLESARKSNELLIKKKS